MTRIEALARLQEIFDMVFLDLVKVTEQLSAHDVPEWDSLTHISLVTEVEENFKVRFRVSEVENTKNVGEFIDLIMKRLQQP